MNARMIGGIALLGLCLAHGAASQAILRFEVCDAQTGRSLPCKLAFIQGGKEPDLQIPPAAGLCAERNGFYTATGRGSVSIPPGSYDVIASRGMEYSIDKKSLTLVEGKTVTARFEIRHEIVPEGFIPCDFHLHTNRSDGRPSPEERIVSLAGEGIAFGPITDHQVITDASGAVQALGLQEYVRTCMGVEYSPLDPHFNAFPVPAVVPGFDPGKTAVHTQIGALQAASTRPVIQVNHPRDGYFSQMNMSPVTSDVDDPEFVWNFDAIEIMNGMGGNGLFTGGSLRYSVWDDWVNFLNRNLRVTGVGNTDTHGSVSSPPGVPRDYVMSTVRNAADINPDDIARSIRKHQLSVARAVFVAVTADGRPMGSEYTPTGGEVHLAVDIKAPSWSGVDSLTVFGNGRVVWSGHLPQPAAGPTNIRQTVALKPDVDTWYVVKVEGKKSLWPALPKGRRGPVTAVGFTNPIWVDIDGKGFECERERIRRMIDEHASNPPEIVDIAKKSDWIFQKSLYGALPHGSPAESAVIASMTASDNEQVRLLGYRRLAQSADRSSLASLEALRHSAPTEREQLIAAAYLGMIKSAGAAKLRNFDFITTNNFVRSWHVIGPFENKGIDTPYPPEEKVDLDARVKGSRPDPAAWKQVHAADDGLVDLRQIFGAFDKSIAYGYAVVEASEDMTTTLLIGSDDGAVVWHNSKEIFRHDIRRSASPGDDLVEVHLTKGANAFLIKVANGDGGSGFYFELLDPEKRLEFE